METATSLLEKCAPVCKRASGYMALGLLACALMLNGGMGLHLPSLATTGQSGAHDEMPLANAESEPASSEVETSYEDTFAESSLPINGNDALQCIDVDAMNLARSHCSGYHLALIKPPDLHLI